MEAHRILPASRSVPSRCVQGGRRVEVRRYDWQGKLRSFRVCEESTISLFTERAQ